MPTTVAGRHGLGSSMRIAQHTHQPDVGWHGPTACTHPATTATLTRPAVKPPLHLPQKIFLKIKPPLPYHSCHPRCAPLLRISLPIKSCHSTPQTHTFHHLLPLHNLLLQLDCALSAGLRPRICRCPHSAPRSR